MIVVTTPTGNIGSQLVEYLLTADQSLRLIARDPEKLPPAVRSKVEVVQGSTDDARILLSAMKGADALFWCVPPPFRAPDPLEHCRRFTRAACQAITANGIQHVVGVSSLGRGVARNAGPVSNAHAIDAMIEETGVAYRALWNPGFMENMLRQVDVIRQKGVFFLPSRADVRAPVVAVRDIAAVAAQLLKDRFWVGQSGVQILGPEDLSYNDMAEIMTEVLGRPIRFQEVAGSNYKANLMRAGASEAFAQGLVDMREAISNGLYSSTSRTSEGTTPTTFRLWCEEVLKPAVGF